MLDERRVPVFSAPAGASLRSTSWRPRSLRARGAGPTVIVSPLLALMRNQIDAAARAGIKARTINSANLGEWELIEEEIGRGEIDAPDKPRASQPSGLPRRCVAETLGHDGTGRRRRGSLHIGLGARLQTRLSAPALLAGLPASILFATTATANERVTADVADQLGDTLV